MARNKRNNELFIGREYLNIEGRQIKHPALIKIYANANTNKTSDTPIKLVGIDIETNHLTAELKLLGYYVEGKYSYDLNNFLNNLFGIVRYCDRKELSIAYWNKLDPFVLYKQFLLQLPKEEQILSMKRFGKIGGEWNRKYGEWTLKPVVEVALPNGWRFGIKNAIRSSIQFFYYRENDNYINYVWAYDIAGLYQSGLEKEASSRLPYYSKVAKEAHLVDWDRFNTDKEFRKLVLYSNELDARAVHDLGISIQNDFYTAFKYYPKSLVSQGSLARSAIVATLLEKYKDLDETAQSKIVYEEVKSIGWLSYYDYLAQKYGSDLTKDLYALTCEAYSGGYIESIRYGYAEEAYTADLTSAYPSSIVDLMDLRNSEVSTGTGTPPHIENSYCFIRGTVNIPLHINYHPITVKHPISKETNIRAVGEYVASYTLEERDYLISVGATFSKETWYNVACKGELSSLAYATTKFYDLRMKLIAEKNSAQFMAKIAMNSVYGITYEAVDTYEDLDNDVERMGYRAGEFFNPLYATIITSRTRLKLARAAQAVEAAGGKPILIMTDSILWTGTSEMLPSDMWTENKTLGYFERPEKVKEVICLGSGRYEYTDDKGRVQAKRRGLNATSIHSPDGIDITDFNWYSALKTLLGTKQIKIVVNVRTLVSVGMVLHNSNYNVNDLGLVSTEVREVDLLVGKNKRNYDEDKLKDPNILATTLVDTESLVLGYGMLGNSKLNDQTLPLLRNKMLLKNVMTKQDRSNKASRKYQKKKYDANKELITKQRKDIYNFLIEVGYISTDAKKMRSWSLERIDMKLKEDNRFE